MAIRITADTRPYKRPELKYDLSTDKVKGIIAKILFDNSEGVTYQCRQLLNRLWDDLVWAYLEDCTFEDVREITGMDKSNNQPLNCYQVKDMRYGGKFWYGEFGKYYVVWGHVDKKEFAFIGKEED